MHITRVINPFTEDGVDRKQLAIVRRRFLHLNTARLERWRNAASDREKQLVDVLPLLFHLNHPALPGWVDNDVPCAIADYTPSAAAIRAARQCSRSFEWEKRASARKPILALFLMGSTGSIAQNSESDLDLWVMLDDELSSDARQKLDQKIHRIVQYAQQINCRLHCFPMTANEFRERRHGHLSTEHAGSTQHRLLLDEFYRTSLWLAGLQPLWWMIPPIDDDYENLKHRLLDKRYLRADDFIDFGAVDRIPPTEFISGAMWQLYKAIDSPYKSVLKLVLMEAYAHSEPPLPPLSQRFKLQIYHGETDVNLCDPYYLVLTAVEEYLTRKGQLSRLNLIRRCFYLKLGERLSVARTNNWRQSLLREWTTQWGWTAQDIQKLDQRRLWKIDITLQERRVLIQELSDSYKMLSHTLQHFESKQTLSGTEQQERLILSRKFYAAFERRSGKVEWINPGIAPDLSEPELTVACLGDTKKVALYIGLHQDLSNSTALPVRQAYDALELLLWARMNGLLTATTRLHLFGFEQHLKWQEIQSITRTLLREFKADVSVDDQMAFLRNAYATRVLVFLNIGADPFGERQRLGLHLVSNRIDPLSYSGQHENLLHNASLLKINSWGEIEYQRFEGPYALAELLHILYNDCDPEGLTPEVDVHCFSPTRPDSLVQRVQQLLTHILGGWRRAAKATPQLYLLQLGAHYIVMHAENGQCTYQAYPHLPALLKRLSEPLPPAVHFSIDREVLQDMPLELIYSQRRQHRVQLFFRQELERVDVWVLDENDALVVSQQAFFDWPSLLKSWSLFLDDVAQRLFAVHGKNVQPPAYFILPSSSQSDTGLKRLNINSTGDKQFTLQAALRWKNNSEEPWQDLRFFCDTEECSELEQGKEVYRHACQLVYNKRQVRQRYPVYLSSLSLSGSEHIEHSAPYIKIRLQLEEKLNNVTLN